MMIHQIWLGRVTGLQTPVRNAITGKWMPPLIDAIRGVHRWCAEHRWKHCLWDWPTLKREFADDSCTQIFERAIAILPQATTYSLMSDYYRLALPARYGGIYLDTDFIVRGMPATTLADVSLMSPVQTAALCANGQRGKEALAIMRECAAEKLLERLGSVKNFGAAYIAYVRRDEKGKGIGWGCIGPSFMRSHMLPAILRAGYSYRCFKQWESSTRNPKTLLYHFNAASWHEKIDWNSLEQKYAG